MQLLFHALLYMRKGAESKSVNISSRPARLIDTFSIALSQETNLHCFSMMLKQYTNTQRTEVENKITTITAQEVSLGKVKDQNVITFFKNMVKIHKEFVTEGKTVNSTVRCFAWHKNYAAVTSK